MCVSLCARYSMATCIFFHFINEIEFGIEIEPGMALTVFFNRCAPMHMCDFDFKSYYKNESTLKRPIIVLLLAYFYT
jgi:hypothetical protein